MKVKHLNLKSGCLKCKEIFDRYPGFDAYLRSWFNDLQKAYPEAHISCAGRGKKEQEECFLKGTSNARWGQSAHNYNLAIDIFRLEVTGASWSRTWFENVVYPALKDKLDKLDWFGLPGSVYFELPHVQVKNWKALVSSGTLKLVE